MGRHHLWEGPEQRGGGVGARRRRREQRGRPGESLRWGGQGKGVHGVGSAAPWEIFRDGTVTPRSQLGACRPLLASPPPPAAVHVALCRHGVAQGCRLLEALDAGARRHRRRRGCAGPSRRDVMKLLP